MLLRGATRLIDRTLRRRQRIEALCRDPDCLFRIRVVPAHPALATAGVPVEPGTPVLELHFRNERLPELPAAGADLVWAAQGARLLRASFEMLADRIRTSPALEQVPVVVGVLTLFAPDDAHVRGRLPERLGFASAPYRSPLGRFGAFWENVYAWLLIRAFNGRSLRGRRLRDMRRTIIWIPTSALLRRYPPSPARREEAGETAARRSRAG